MIISDIYKTEQYSTFYNKIFAGVYNDFKNTAEKTYKFELAPLSYENFIKSINDGLIRCILLLENDIPTGFLAYTTIISEAIELNIIHCIGEENINLKRRLLLEKFLELNKNMMTEKIVTYPMMGPQKDFVQDILEYGFEIINTSVMKFDLRNNSAINKAKEMEVPVLNNDYSITNWKFIYRKYAAEVICDSFKESSDAMFDSRFKTYKGSSDIVEKITRNIYGKFLPAVTKILLYKRRPVGFCFANLTNDKIANIPIAAILKEHRGNGFSKIMLKHLISDLLNSVILEGHSLKELNVSCDADNIAAVSMYKSAGFIEDYTYPIAYRQALI